MRVENLSQKRAQKAWDFVGEIKELPETDNKKKKEYRSYVRSASALILTNGLAQTLAFWKSNNDKQAYVHLAKHLSEMVLENNAEDLFVKAKNCSVEEYMYLTDKSLGCLLWLKRFAEALLPSEGDEG